MRTLALIAWSLVHGLTGCQSSYPASSVQYRTALLQGSHADAVEVAQSAAKSEATSEIVWRLELATSQRLAGDSVASSTTFERVETLFRQADQEPDIALGSETLSTLSDPYSLLYRGRNLDRIFAATYQAIDHLHLGEMDKARICLTRSLFRQEDARRRQTERRQAAKDELSTLTQGDAHMAERLSDPTLSAVLTETNSRFQHQQAYADALNPFAVWLNGIYHLQRAESPTDLERARKSLETASLLCKDNRFISDDLVLAEKCQVRPEPSPGKTIVYVVHETGLAPAWSETSILLPLIYADSRAPMVRIALPTISPQGERPAPTRVSVGSTNVQLATLADVDGIVRAEFEEDYPRARTRAIASATLKATVGYLANREAQKRRQSDGGNLLAVATLLATNAYAINSARADLRNWSSLPSEIRHGRIEVPNGSKLRLSGGWIPTDTHYPIPQGKVVLITIRSISQDTPAIIRTCILQP